MKSGISFKLTYWALRCRLGYRRNNIGHELIIAEVDDGLHGSSLCYSLYFYSCLKIFKTNF